MKIIFCTKDAIQAAVMAAFLAMAAMGAAFAAGDQDASPASGSTSVGAAVTDATITANIKSKLHGTSSLDNADINVNTNNGVVTLSGSVPDEQAKSRAEQIARSVDGVSKVEGRLKVSGGGGESASGEGFVSDSWITTKVKSKIVADNADQGFKVNVKTDNGVVILKGILPNEQDVQHVKGLAEQVEGVKRVDTSALTASTR